MGHHLHHLGIVHYILFLTFCGSIVHSTGHCGVHLFTDIALQYTSTWTCQWLCPSNSFCNRPKLWQTLWHLTAIVSWQLNDFPDKNRNSTFRTYVILCLQYLVACFFILRILTSGFSDVSLKLEHISIVKTRSLIIPII